MHPSPICVRRSDSRSSSDDVDTGYGLIGSLREYAMRTLRYEVFNWADIGSGS